MTNEAESLLTDELRASIGVESALERHELDKTSVRMFARAVGHTDQVFYDEEYARSRGHRSLLAPPGYLGTPVYNPKSRGFAGPGIAGPGGRTLRALNGGSEYEYGGVEICAGDVLTAVSKTLSIDERSGSLGPMLIIRRETVYTNQDGQVVCRAFGTLIAY